jgi:hypothetical protein
MNRENLLELIKIIFTALICMILGMVFGLSIVVLTKYIPNNPLVFMTIIMIELIILLFFSVSAVKIILRKVTIK